MVRSVSQRVSPLKSAVMLPDWSSNRTIVGGSAAIVRSRTGHSLPAESVALASKVASALSLSVSVALASTLDAVVSAVSSTDTLMLASVVALTDSVSEEDAVVSPAVIAGQSPPPFSWFDAVVDARVRAAFDHESSGHDRSPRPIHPEDPPRPG